MNMFRSIAIATTLCVTSVAVPVAAETIELVLVRKVDNHNRMNSLTDRCIRYMRTGGYMQALQNCKSAARIADEQLAAVDAAALGTVQAEFDVGLAYSNLAAVTWYYGRAERAREYIAKAREAAPQLNAVLRNSALIEAAPLVQTAER